MDTPNHTSSGMFAGASPKLTFVFGVISGVAATALIALVIFMTTGAGARSKNTATGTANTNSAPVYGDVRPFSDKDLFRGNKDAKVKLIVYTDLECPYCQRFHPVMKQVVDNYGDDVAWVYRQFPLSFHANAQKEAEASLCVNKLGGQEKYWSFIDKIFERTTANGTGFALANLGALAKEVGVNQDKFQSCLDDGEMASAVAEDESDGTQAGATGTPTTFVVGDDDKTITAIPGAYTYDQVKTIVEQALSS